MNEFLAGLAGIANGVLPQVAQKALEDNGLIDKATPVTVNPTQPAGERWKSYLVPVAVGVVLIVAAVLIVRRKG